MQYEDAFSMHRMEYRDMCDVHYILGIIPLLKALVTGVSSYAFSYASIFLGCEDSRCAKQKKSNWINDYPVKKICVQEIYFFAKHYVRMPHSDIHLCNHFHAYERYTLELTP